MINGFRRYQLRGNTLYGATGQSWDSREFVAECNKSAARAEYHLTDDIDCSCGIYVARDDYVAGYQSFPVLAAITGWGAFIEYEKGWRIQHVRIEHMWIEGAFDTNSIDAIKEKYQCGVEVKSNVASWVSAPQYQPNYKVNPQACDKCKGTHDLSPWTPKGRPSLRVCQMETSHVSNAKKYLEHLSNIGLQVPWHKKWVAIFEQSLKDRAPRVDPTTGNVSIKW